MNEARRIGARVRVFASFILLASSLLSAGCVPVAALHYKIKGPDPIPAQYVPAKEPMLVMVETYKGSVAGYSEAETLARYLMVELTEHDIAPLIPIEKLYALRTNKPDAYRTMSMTAIGREVGAKQVLYVDLQQSAIGAPPGSELIKGRVAVQVRVVDVETGDTRWPAQATEGIPLGYETPLPRANENATEAIVRAKMHSAMAERIAKLFYKWKPDTNQDTLDMGESR
ncbi:MAG: hypothetical protein WBD40_14100 [Tepidisphaeraceae bacterium]